MSLKSRVSQAFDGLRQAAAERPSAKPSETAAGGSSGRPHPSQTLTALVVELGKLVREMVAIPVQLWLAIAEPVGAATLWVWRQVARPAISAVIAGVGIAYRFALRHVTPARATVVVALVAIGVLVASQWVDYRGVRVGNDAYTGDAGIVAPAPEVAREQAGEAHSWVMLPLAAAALIVLALAVTGRWRMARLLMPIGIAVVAIAVLIDAPNGLDEGKTAIAYEGASAHLLDGFWLQIAAGAGMIASGLLLPGFLRPDRAPASAARARPRRSRERGTLPVGEART